LANLSGFAQTNNIPDADFKAILLTTPTQNSITQNIHYQSIKIDSNNDGEN
jgi:hypothetical protein